MLGDIAATWTDVEGVATLVTAGATIALGYFTWVLAKETKRLSRASAQAHVVATIEPNPWASNHADLIVTNTGNAAAHEIQFQFTPPLPASPYHKNGSVPLQNISILKPGHSLHSHLSEFKEVSKRTYRVSVSWKLHPAASKREHLSYDLSMTDYEAVAYLGARSPLIQIAEQVKKLREDWEAVSRGNRRLAVNTHSEADRKREQEELNELWAKEELDAK